MVVDVVFTVYRDSPELERSLSNLLAVTRVLRLLRPLLVVRRVPWISVAIDALWHARQLVFLCFCLASLFVFQVVAIYQDLYSSRLHHCVDRSVSYNGCVGFYMKEALALGTQAVTRFNPARLDAAIKGGVRPIDGALGILAPLAWVPPESVHFDTQLEVVTALGMIACPFSQGWGELAEKIMGVRGRGVGTGLGNWWAALPLMLTILVLHVVLFSLLVAVMIRSIRETNGLAFFTDAQRSWNATKRLIHRSNSLISQPIVSLTPSMHPCSDPSPTYTPIQPLPALSVLS